MEGAHGQDSASTGVRGAGLQLGQGENLCHRCRTKLAFTLTEVFPDLSPYPFEPRN